MLWYIAVVLSTILSAVYGGILLLSHYPRVATESERKYVTNTSGTYDLPTISTTSLADSKVELTVVVPCYNEVARLGKMLEEAAEFLEENYSGNYEILIVDDGSSDGTANYALEKATQLGLKPHVLKVCKLAKNRGKGGAVTHGVLHASGKYVLFADADGATQFSDATKLVASLEEARGPKVAVGLRAHMVNTDAVVKRSFIRNFLMYGLHTLVFIFGIRKIQDTQCGFKMFNREAVQKIFPHMHTERWIFDVEVLLLAELQKIPIDEIAVSWQEIDGSKVDLAKDSVQMAVDLVVTRLAYLLGVYGLDECGRKS